MHYYYHETGQGIFVSVGKPLIYAKNVNVKVRGLGMALFPLPK